jgi:peptide/nickel transport system ATP-binding protein/oligopeptide transport system ATP-binding protein
MKDNHIPLVEVKNLVKYYPVLGGILQRPVAWVKAVENVSFSINRGETLSLVGETGCGKSTVGLTMLSLVPHNSGSVLFEGVDLFGLDRQSLKGYRRNMQIVFQDPFSSLDPRLPVGESIAEGLKIHKIGTEKDRFEMVLKTMKEVGLEDYHAMRYPHEFSGGQRQRIGIARALIMQPKFIVLDEPVSALDVSIQAQILNILKDLQKEYNLTYLFVAHNLAVVEHISDRVAVMYLGKIIEKASREQLFSRPMHPYTQALISAIPAAHPKQKKDRIILKGDVPSALHPPSGCYFHPRCPVARPDCAQIEPPLEEKGGDHQVACRYA